MEKEDDIVVAIPLKAIKAVAWLWASSLCVSAGALVADFLKYPSQDVTDIHLVSSIIGFLGLAIFVRAVLMSEGARRVRDATMTRKP